MIANDQLEVLRKLLGTGADLYKIELAALAAAIATIERLPVTKDKYHVAPGENVFPRHMLDDDLNGTALQAKCYIVDPVTGEELVESDELDISQCYSTALAAKGGGDA